MPISINPNLIADLETCVIYNQYVINEDEPMLVSNYCVTNNTLNFDQARIDIVNATEIFTDIQITHFKIILDFLKSKQFLLKEASVHIYLSDLFETKHYLRIDNIDRQYSMAGSNYMLKYDCNIFAKYEQPVTIMSSIKNFILRRVLSSCKHTEGHMISKNLSSGDKIMSLFDKLTVSNCFLYTLLQFLKADIIDRPFKSTFVMIVSGILYSCLGLIISNIFPKYSSITFNSAMFYVNYSLYKKNKLTN